ncbi:hypothetical protein [Flavihumibacter sp. CACIAM 22H1]|uniref:hypothetical protein n=1 Tax=Flavihumibacter sp. CACIAM 22H1 TaxID=1812911 RepID=UPI0007A88664|nr:hypothetical protein [Flavihumibacter sp. CACIAM 22H1]KYP15580.1 MAG: hypothetical protein A1D16_08015 [Flavihumibacter sp. CACIAM 22H1]
MAPIFSKRHIFKFYISVAIGFIFLLLMGLTLLFAYLSTPASLEKMPKQLLLLLAAIATCMLAFYTVYKYVKNVPTIILDADIIYIGNNVYAYSEIKRIRLTGKQAFRLLIDFPMEATAITLEDNRTIFLFDDMYSNSWEIKSFLKQVIQEKKEYIAPSPSFLPKDTGKNELYENFKGNPVTSLRGLSIVTFCLLIGFALLTNSKPLSVVTILFFSGFTSGWIFLNAWMMHFFQVSAQYFVVRNHLYFWKRTVYDLNQVKEIVFETQGKLPNCVRIITKDFRSKLYPACTLRKRHWLALKEKIRAHKIKLRNECI